MEMKVQVPGRFLLWTTASSGPWSKGALGILEMAGAEQPGIFKTLGPGTHGAGGHKPPLTTQFCGSDTTRWGVLSP